MIPNKERWHYVVVKYLSAFLREITSKHEGDLHCLNCLNSFKIKNKFESNKKVGENKDIFNVIKTSERL